MGYPWKMFTQTQVKELISGTNHTWTTINGVNGAKFVSKTDSTKYIFFPAAGSFGGTNNQYIGSAGYYWSNDRTSSNNAYNMSINSNGPSIYAVACQSGASVRAII